LAQSAGGGQLRNHLLGAPDGGADVLRAADALGLRYTLVHHGPPDRQPGGTYERAHHRVESHQLPELARRLLARDRLLVTCLAFAYKNGIPEGAAWLVDVRFLENPYWVPELKDLDGRHPAVREFVLMSPAATHLLDGLQSTFESVLDDYRLRGRMELIFAFGCTGGQHRSVTMASEMAERLRRRDDIDVELSFRDLGAEAAARER
jgi:RNase adaptor protein for sRNA GlmZ degradation